jgi:hypothetical protein
MIAANWRQETTNMDATKFDVLARRLVSGLTRRDTVRGLVAGAGALAIGGALKQAASAKRCRKAGDPCDKNGECCPKDTGRICKQPNPPSGSKVCCSTRGEKCGGERPSGPKQPQCCFPLECSNKNGGVCR